MFVDPRCKLRKTRRSTSSTVTMGILTHDEILELRAAIVSAQLVASRDALLVGIDLGIVAGLPTAANPSDHLLSNLGALNEAKALADGTVPLVAWLRNAVAKAGGKKEGAVFRRALERCEAATALHLGDPLCPFPGLEFFDEDRAADFFGREAQITEALAQLSESRPARRWLQIDGPSGAGKSSFARAGIVPAVRAGRLMVGPKAWVATVMRPGYDPITSLAEALVKHAKPPLNLSGLDLDDVRTKLAGSPTALASLLREGRADGHGVLLVVDQLEETFTLAHADESGVKQFDALLATALDDREGPLVLVTTIRSDFVARMGELLALEEKLPTQAVRYYLRPMDEPGLRAAIRKPAERAGLVYEEGLVDRIVADASTSRGALPLVAHVLEALYARRDGFRLTTRAYDLVGGVAGALAMSADAIIDSLEAEDRARARKLLLRLVKIGRGNEDTRQTATREIALGAAGGHAEAERVLARLSGGRVVGLGGTTSASGRLLVVSGEAGKERVDLVHEALIQRWGTLRTWVKNAREELERRDDVEEAARIWEASGSSEDGLPRGTALARFQGVDRGALQEGARAYLEAAEEAERRSEEDRRARDKEKRRAEEERARFQRRVIVGLVAFVVALGLAAGVAIWQRNKALDEASRADISTTQANVFRLRAEREARVASARGLAAESPVAGIEGLPQRQLLLAVEASNLAHSSGTPFLTAEVQSLSDALQSSSHHVVLVGHDGDLFTGVFSPDGRRIATASRDCTARVWNTDGSGTPIILRGHESVVWSVAFSPDGKQVVTGSADKTARIWDVDNARSPVVLRGHTGEVRTAEFSPDGHQIVTASRDATSRVWSASGDDARIVLRGHLAEVWGAKFSPDGRRIATASEDATVRVWSADGTATPVILRGHTKGVETVAFSPDGKRILSASRDRTARVWNADGTGKPIVFSDHNYVLSKALFSPSGRQVATSDDDAVRVWNADGTGQPVVIRGYQGISLLAFNPNGRLLITTSRDQVTRIWNTDGSGEPISLRGHENEVTSASFSPDGCKVLTTSDDNTARIWHSDGAPELSVLNEPTYASASVSFSHDGKRLVTASWNNAARVWDFDTRDWPIVLPGHELPLTDVAFSPDDQRIATASMDRTARIWSADGTGQAVVLRGHEKEVTHVAFSPDGKHVATVSADNTARLWNIDGSGGPQIVRGLSQSRIHVAFRSDGQAVFAAADGNVVKVWTADNAASPVVLRGHEKPVIRLAVSSDARYVAAAAKDHTLRVWSVDGSGDPVVLRGHDFDIHSVAFSPDGSRVVTASDDETARVWSTNGQTAPIILSGHVSIVDGAAFSPDGNRVVTYSFDNTIRVWNADGTGEPLIYRSRARIAAASFSSDGKRVVFASDSPRGSIHVWTVDAHLLAEMACARAGRNFTREEWRRFFGDEPYRKTCPQWPEAPPESATTPTTPTLLPSTVLPVTTTPSLVPSSSSP